MLRRTLLREAGLAEKLNCNTVLTEDSVDPMAFQRCPKLKQEAWHLYTYIIPSMLAMPRRGHDLRRGSSLQTRPIPQKGRWVSLSWKVWQFWGAQHCTYYNKFICISIAVIYSVNLYNLKLLSLFSIISFTIFTTVSSLLYSFQFILLSYFLGSAFSRLLPFYYSLDFSFTLSIVFLPVIFDFWN